MIIKKLRNKRLLILSITALVLIGGSTLVYMKINNSNSSSENGAAEPTAKLNLDPPTDEEKKSADDNKQAIVDQEQRIQNQPSSSGKKSVKPIITYAGQSSPQGKIEVGGYINEVFEEGGTCTATFRKGSSTFSKNVKAVKNVRSVDCPTVTAAVSDFTSKGSWAVILSYDSSSASGSSDVKTIEVN